MAFAVNHGEIFRIWAQYLVVWLSWYLGSSHHWDRAIKNNDLDKKLWHPLLPGNLHTSEPNGPERNLQRKTPIHDQAHAKQALCRTFICG